MGAHEVTWQECELFRKEKRWWNSDDFHLMQYLLNGNKEYSETFRPTGPVVGMTWYTAVAYCEWLSEKTGCYFRLPTEREWEYVARAGDDQSVPLDDKAWHLGNSGGWIHPVGQKMSNSFGIHDMLATLGSMFLNPPHLRDLIPSLVVGPGAHPQSRAWPHDGRRLNRIGLRQT